ncbi:glycosyltransferase family 2 protein [Magnetospirillum sp. UT-4]|uniref:glycosyltransferase family 2 protein n=1 Tax=Magnetospirillum sp. UT-4 TaxID=2681467 RepID=UPI001385D86E|nr:glycosyltransferase family 2 protein [Magnetospirillum sp. UT-4]CAA7621642.1 Glycosyl transferase [Magnetospirillum sp. UT-4]
MTRKIISIVTAVFNEEDNVEECHKAVRALFDGPLADYDFEHIFADNCSTDRTVEILRRMAEAEPRIKVILNARNFGPMRSSFNALMATSGDAAVPLLAADLQDPPELIVEFVKRWEEGFEVVHGVREARDEGRVLSAVKAVYYRTVSQLSSVQVPPNVGEFQLIDRKVVEALRSFDDHYPYPRGMIARCGFRTTGIPYRVKARARGMSKNRVWNLIDQGMNGLVSTSNVPLRVSMIAGLVISVLAISFAILELFINLLFFREFQAPGIGLLITALFFFSGVQLFFIGVLGEYIGSIHAQVRGGPLVVERGRINF